MDTIKFDKKQVKMVAHRGVSGLEMENTNAAFVAAGTTQKMFSTLYKVGIVRVRAWVGT